MLCNNIFSVVIYLHLQYVCIENISNLYIVFSRNLYNICIIFFILYNSQCRGRTRTQTFLKRLFAKGKGNKEIWWNIKNYSPARARTHAHTYARTCTYTHTHAHMQGMQGKPSAPSHTPPSVDRVDLALQLIKYMPS